jgi:hypothetical protein
MANSKKDPKKGFMGFFSILLFLTIVFAGILWIIYGYLPYAYYLPLSAIGIVLFGVLVYFVLRDKIIV